MLKKLATALCQLSIIRKTYHQFNSGMHYLFFRMGSFEFVTHQRWVTLMLSKDVKSLTKGECHVPAGKSVSIVSLN